jgi:HEAT repeat protein
MGLFGITVSDILKWEKEKKVDKIVPAFTSKNIEVRKAAISAFGNMRVTNGAPFLIRFLNDDDSSIRKTTRIAILKIGHPAIADLEKAKGEINQSGFDAILQNVNKYVWQYSEDQLNTYKNENILKIFEVVLQGKHKDDPRMQCETIINIYNQITDRIKQMIDPVDKVLKGLGLLEKKEKVNSIEYQILDEFLESKDIFLLSNILGKTADESQRQKIFFAICNNNAPGSSQFILNGLKDRNDSIRAIAVENLEKAETSNQFDLLVHSLNDFSENVKTKAAKALGKLQNNLAIPHLVDALNRQKHTYSDLYLTILYSLVSLGHHINLSQFINDLNASTLHTRQSAAETLIKIAGLNFSLVRSQWNVLVSKIEKPNIDHNDGTNIYYSDCGTHEDNRRHTDSPGIGVRIPDELRSKR